MCTYVGSTGVQTIGDNNHNL